MHPTKAELICKNGMRCMLCGKEVSYRQMNWHHIIPKFIFKKNKKPVDNSYENGALLCLDCHAFVHSYPYWSDEYQYYMDVIRQNKK
jgi:5-methylcytosine-specific restriction endonuclease McrA